jgi:hypothetical protein
VEYPSVITVSRGYLFKNGSKNWWIGIYVGGEKWRESTGTPDRVLAEKMLAQRQRDILDPLRAALRLSAELRIHLDHLSQTGGLMCDGLPYRALRWEIDTTCAVCGDLMRTKLVVGTLDRGWDYHLDLDGSGRFGRGRREPRFIWPVCSRECWHLGLEIIDRIKLQRMAQWAQLRDARELLNEARTVVRRMENINAKQNANQSPEHSDLRTA